MENALFSKLTQFGFSAVNNNICVGTWKNYAVTLQKYSGKNYFIYVAIRIEKASKELKKALHAAVRANGGKKAAVSRVMPNFVHGTLSFGKVENELNDFSAYLEALTEALRGNGVMPANTCAMTGAANPDSLCLIPRSDCFGYQPVCSAVIRESDQEVQARAADNEGSGSYLTGIIGAVLGMLVGIAVNLLTMVFLERIFSLLFALVPVAAMFGYKLFKGKANKAAIVIVIVLSVIAVPLMEFLAGAITVAREYDVSFFEAMQATAKLFFEPEVLKETGPEMLKILLFMALGVFIGWSYLRGQLNSTQLQSSKLQLDTMRPNPLYQAPQQ